MSIARFEAVRPQEARQWRLVDGGGQGLSEAFGAKETDEACNEAPEEDEPATSRRCPTQKPHCPAVHRAEETCNDVCRDHGPWRLS
ncbi:MAG: hypothetical protein LW626_13755 [Verrucomicrobium sp.]|nr:hypothetical protein [Verrucomicrobium sp.]